MAVSHVSKFKKYHKQIIRIKSQAVAIREPLFGTFALRTREASRFTEWHLEAVQRGLRRNLKKNGYIWFIGTPTIPVSAKPTNIRMGKGKGAVSFWSQKAPTGASLFEGAGATRDILARAVNGIKKKIPCQASMVWAAVKLHQ